MSALQDRLAAVRECISNAAKSAGRSPDEIRLVVVTKGHPAKVIQELHALGVREIGESYVEEGIEKQKSVAPLEGLVWHMIGHVQSRKANAVAASFDLVHSVDSLKLAEKLDRFARQSARVLPLLLECNVSGESSKYGWPAWEQGRWAEFSPEIEKILELPNIRVHGLMSMAPYSDDPESSRPFFARTRQLRDFLAGKFPGADWGQLSMGMSGDFGAAIKEGATIVRIGTAIVGERPGRV